MSIPNNLTGKDLFDFLIENKSTLMHEKKMQNKFTDAMVFTPTIDKEETTDKATTTEQKDVNKIKVKVVINTTNILDSHGDVHLDGIWNKSLKENKNLYLLQEHKMSFDHIISDKVKASAEQLTWRKAGVNASGDTQALIFEAEIDKDRNGYMFEQYQKGYVKNHSVGMRYVKLDLAIKDERYPEEFAVWEKYYSLIVNKKDVDNLGYFWAVQEAKIMEGSAVPMGSNYATPTLEVEENKDIQEPTVVTPEQVEPSVDTQSKLTIYSFN